jgi:hypothetical protein
MKRKGKEGKISKLIQYLKQNVGCKVMADIFV